MESIDAEPYNPQHYFEHRHGDARVEHCIGNSTDNLSGLVEGVAVEGVQIPAVQPQPTAPWSKPNRSDLNAPIGGDTDGVVVPPPPHVIHVTEHHRSVDGLIDAEVFVPTEYYSEIRRRSLEGRAPLRLGEETTGAHPFEETIASEELDVALY